jgi:hypothetical protein
MSAAPQPSVFSARELIHGPHGLTSNKCICSRWKPKARSFCGACYHNLPAELRRALYRRIGEGYEAAFTEAVKFLAEQEG